MPSISSSTSSYMFKNSADILQLCEKYQQPISEVVIRYEMEISDMTREEVMGKMRKVAAVMKEAIDGGIHAPKKSLSGMSGGSAGKLLEYFEKGSSGGGAFLNELAIRAMMYAIATGETNACMGRIAAFPTAGGSGVIPGVIMAITEMTRGATEESQEIAEEKMLGGLFTASAIGIVIAENATLSAAAAGCQAEVGAANACAAAAAVEMRGGTPEQAVTAAAMAMKSALGLACDPLGGLVEVPCIKRNALGTQHALGAADLALAGVVSYIPFDEVVEAMWNIGKLMSPKLRETALGGLAVTPTGMRIRAKLGLPPLKKLTVQAKLG